ncbi:hemin-degrading factor [Arsenicitalea aurantiaca]|uniref:Hemin-degrading factor n=1 Tax=Arsenicitalea aurantiaca TaxID=1783274 RepID=A0A433X8L7_9HYPH|nr:ChuX/HutX family heme-like substrate-binding protein [Arsenicitalea aurantiaca]RUT30390.1 hemin-degrading factor [Arsenicitalea aurantiaca]
MDRRQLPPEQIRTLRAAHPKMRERDFARIHAITEAELVSAYCGQGVLGLRPDVETLLAGLKQVGEVMALTRNESVVHEKIGIYEDVHFGQKASMVLGENIDLRIFPERWAFGFAVERPSETGELRRSLQFFDRFGDAVHKVHARPGTDLAAWHDLVGRLQNLEQDGTLDIETPSPEVPSGPAADREELRARWESLTDTHQFFPMLKALNLGRHEALNMVGADYAWPLDAGAVAGLFAGAVAEALPVMVFVGNRGCIQIHSGPIVNVAPMGPWLNVMDETFHMHLRTDQIAEAWAVRKPTKDGHVTSVELYGADRELILQMFGKRHEGVDERPDWRRLVEALPPAGRSTAA